MLSMAAVAIEAPTTITTSPLSEDEPIDVGTMHEALQPMLDAAEQQMMYESFILQGQLTDIEDFVIDRIRKINEYQAKQRRASRKSKKVKQGSKAELVNDLERFDVRASLPTQREYLWIFMMLRNCLNLAAKIGPRLAAPLTEAGLTAKLVEYHAEMVSSQRDFAFVRAINKPVLAEKAVSNALRMISDADKKYWMSLGSNWNAGVGMSYVSQDSYVPTFSRMDLKDIFKLSNATTGCMHSTCTCTHYISPSLDHYVRPAGVAEPDIQPLAESVPVGGLLAQLKARRSQMQMESIPEAETNAFPPQPPLDSFSAPEEWKQPPFVENDFLCIHCNHGRQFHYNYTDVAVLPTSPVSPILSSESSASSLPHQSSAANLIVPPSPALPTVLEDAVAERPHSALYSSVIPAHLRAKAAETQRTEAARVSSCILHT
jgi:hypothetical protein